MTYVDPGVLVQVDFIISKAVDQALVGLIRFVGVDGARSARLSALLEGGARLEADVDHLVERRELSLLVARVVGHDAVEPVGDISRVVRDGGGEYRRGIGADGEDDGRGLHFG